MSATSADVVVVGSGAAGCAVAGELARSGASVVVVEAGPQGSAGHVRNPDPGESGLNAYGEAYNSLLTPHSHAEATPGGMSGLRSAHAVGGMVNLWLNNCPVPDVSELPDYYSRDEWQRLFDRSRAILAVHEDLERGSKRLERLLELLRIEYSELGGDRGVQPMPLAARLVDGRFKWTGSDDLLAVEDEGDPVTIVPDHIVRGIKLDGDSAAGVVAHPRDGGDTLTIDAGAVILAAGVIGTPQLLVASSIDAGPALGRYVLDHPLFFNRVPLKPEVLADVPDDDPLFTVWLPYSEDHPVQTWVQRINDEMPLPEGLEARQTADVITQSGMEPRPENRFVFHADRLDPFGLPDLEVEFSLSTADRALAAGSAAEQYRVSATIGLTQSGWSTMMVPPGTSLHVCGSCRMGDDPETSAVDSDGRLWNYENLYAAGNAVIGFGVAENPTFTALAMATRTVDSVLAAVGATVAR